MDDVKKMFRTIVNGQSAMKSELLGEIGKVSVEVKEIKQELKGSEKRLTKRINKLGKQIAYVEDDAPTVKEFDKLEKRVTKPETRFV
jgi:hypothetical protein